MAEFGSSLVGRVRDRGARLSWAVFDQVLSSGTNLMLLVLVLRESTGTVFGAFSVAMVVQGLLLGGSRAMVGEVLVLRVRRDPGRLCHDRRHALSVVLVVSTCAAILVASVALALPAPLSDFLLVIAAALPFVLVHDVQRYLALAAGRPRDAVALDVGWFVVQAGVSVLVLTHGGGAIELVLAWAAGAALSAIIGLVVSRWTPTVSGLSQTLHAERRRSVSFVSDLALSTGVNQTAYLVLAAVLSLTGFGLLRFALLVTSPLTNLFGTARVLTLGYFARKRASDLRLWRVIWAQSAAYGVLTVVFVLPLLALPTDVGVAVFGDLWSAVRPLLLLASVGEALRVAQFPLIDFLKSCAPPSTLVRTRLATGLITALSLLLGGVWGGPSGALTALVAGHVVAGALWLRSARSATRPQCRGHVQNQRGNE